MVYEKELKKLLKLMDAFKKSGIKEFNDPELDNMVYEAQAIGKAENNPKKNGWNPQRV